MISSQQIQIDDKFIKKIQKLVINGYTCNLMERSVPKNENLDRILKEESVSNWRKVKLINLTIFYIIDS